MDDDDLLEVLRAASDAVRRALDGLDDWSLAGTRTGQYRSDLAADDACLAVLDDAGLGWLSEESGGERLDRAIVVIVDPVDGSTNASRGIPWFATSLCAVDHQGPRVSVVTNQASGRRYEAVKGRGATVDGRPLRPSDATELRHSVVALSGYPHRDLGWQQFRAMGAAALDLCAVAEGIFDGYVDCSPDAHGSWDYAGGLLVCAEAGVPVVDAFDRELIVLTQEDRRTPVAGATGALLHELLEARRSLRWPDDPHPPGATEAADSRDGSRESQR